MQSYSQLMNAAMLLPREGELVTIPVLFASSTPYKGVSLAVTAAATVAANGTTAAITYATLRLLAILVQCESYGATAPMHVQHRTTNINLDGEGPLLYGSHCAVIEPVAALYGKCRYLIPCLRDNPIIKRNQVAYFKSSFVAMYTLGAAVVSGIQAEFICETYSDPAAEAN